MRLLRLQEWMIILMRNLKTSMIPHMYTLGKMRTKLISNTTKNTIILILIRHNMITMMLHKNKT